MAGIGFLTGLVSGLVIHVPHNVYVTKSGKIDHLSQELESILYYIARSRRYFPGPVELCLWHCLGQVVL